MHALLSSSGTDSPQGRPHQAQHINKAQKALAHITPTWSTLQACQLLAQWWKHTLFGQSSQKPWRISLFQMPSILRVLLLLLAVPLHHWAEVSKVQPSSVGPDAKGELEFCKRSSWGSRNSEQGCWNWGKRLLVGSPTSCLWLAASPSLLLSIYRDNGPLAWRKKIHFVPDFPEGAWPAGTQAGKGSTLVSNKTPQAGVLG